MQDAELFLSLAEIAGVFVGFGALIALRSSGPTDTTDVLMIGMVVWVAIAVVIVALAPIAVSGFGITGHALWLACSVIALLVFYARRLPSGAGVSLLAGRRHRWWLMALALPGSPGRFLASDAGDVDARPTPWPPGLR